MNLQPLVIAVGLVAILFLILRHWAMKDFR